MLTKGAKIVIKQDAAKWTALTDRAPCEPTEKVEQLSRIMNEADNTVLSARVHYENGDFACNNVDNLSKLLERGRERS